jgi:hypothetical protein
MKLYEMKAERDKLEGWVKPQPCMVCGKTVPGAYGMWAKGWTCRLKCEETYVAALLPQSSQTT